MSRDPLAVRVKAVAWDVLAGALLIIVLACAIFLVGTFLLSDQSLVQKATLVLIVGAFLLGVMAVFA